MHQPHYLIECWLRWFIIYYMHLSTINRERKGDHHQLHKLIENNLQWKRCIGVSIMMWIPEQHIRIPIVSRLFYYYSFIVATQWCCFFHIYYSSYVRTFDYSSGGASHFLWKWECKLTTNWIFIHMDDVEEEQKKDVIENGEPKEPHRNRQEKKTTIIHFQHSAIVHLIWIDNFARNTRLLESS